jgi:hypothetical protein
MGEELESMPFEGVLLVSRDRIAGAARLGGSIRVGGSDLEGGGSSGPGFIRVAGGASAS